MPYLDAALAFALTMLAIATLVTQTVSLGHAAFKFRFKQLKAMLLEYFNTSLKPIIVREIERLGDQVEDKVKDEIKKQADDLLNTLQLSDDVLEGLAEVSKDELLVLLKQSDLGKSLLGTLKEEADSVFAELEKRYEAIERKFTKSFRKNARTWATVVALILAFALNIDSIFIVNTYITNEGMRQAVIAQKDSLEDGYTAIAEKFEQDQQKETITREEFEQAFADTKEQLDVFTSAGFPIGWSYFPHSALKLSDLKLERVAPEDLSKEFQDRNNSLGWLIWVLGCILTGLLAGLGGPFWYDVVASISHAVKSVRGQKN